MEHPMTVIVIGMHRSGTSLVTRLISELGCNIGHTRDHLEPNQWNPAGYLEDKELVAISDKLLRSQDCSWSDGIRFNPKAVDPSVRRHAQNRYHYLLKRLSNASDSIVLKDPRLCLTLPVLKPDARSTLVVFVLRHPLAIAASLDTRDNFGMAISLALWELYSLRACRAVQSLTHHSIIYSDLQSKAWENVSQLASKLVDFGAIEQPADMTLEKACGVIKQDSNDMSTVKEFAEFMLPWYTKTWKLLQEDCFLDLAKSRLSAHSRDLLIQHRKLMKLRQQGHPAFVAREEGGKTRSKIDERIDALEQRLERIEGLLN